MDDGAEREVPPELEGARLDGAVRALRGTSWGEARKLVARGKVFVDGEVELDGARPVRAGDRIAVRLEARVHRPGAIEASRVVFLDRHVVVVDKPPGVLTVPWQDDDRGTLLDLLRRHLARIDPGGPRTGSQPTLHVVHRLDRGTSGLLAVARTRGVAEGLRAQLRAHTTHRLYLALAHGRVAPGTLRSHLLADRGDGRRGSRERGWGRKAHLGRGGKVAVTHLEVGEALEGATLVRCRLETGRTNQIRIHLAEAGHPLLGETVYLRDYRGPVLEAPRLMLHAAELGFVHPGTSAPLRFRADPPEDFASRVTDLRRRP